MTKGAIVVSPTILFDDIPREHKRGSGRVPGRLVGLEFRRGDSLWMIPVGLIALGFALRDLFASPIVIWPEEVVALRDAITFYGPLFAAAAAWMATRESRRGAGELLATTPLPAAARQITTWAGTAIAATVAYVLLVIPVMVVTATRATWGGPDWWPVMVGLTAMVAHSALGFAAGTWFPSRYVAPTIAILLFLGQLYVGTVAGHEASPLTIVSRLDDRLGEWRYLSPIAETSRDVSYGIWPAVGMWQALWFLGGAGVMLSLAAMRPRPTLGPAIALAISLVVSLGGATGVVQRTGSEPFGPAFQRHTETQPAAAWEPACAGDLISVCVHPAYAARLDELATRTNRVLAPVAGRPGVPTTVIQHDPSSRIGSPSTLPAEGSITISLDTDIGWTMFYIAHWLESGSMRTREETTVSEEGGMVQTVIARWLLLQAGESIHLSGFTLIDPAGPEATINDHVTRFAALDEAARSRWFDIHIADLLGGTLTLDDLP